MKRPWMPLYVGDYLADTGHLSAEETGVYFLFVMHYWATKSLPKDEKSLACLARLTKKKWQAIEPKIRPLFGPDWTHNRIDQEIEKTIQISSKRAAAGSSGGIANAVAKSKQLLS